MLDNKEFSTFIKKKKLEEFEEDLRKELEQILKKTLEEKMNKSFSLVNERLEQVYKGLGEM